MKHLVSTCVIFFVGLLGGALTVSAHDASGSLGADPTATDLHLVTCFNDGGGVPDHLLFELNGGLPSTAPTVSAQIQIPDKLIAMSTTDPVNGDAGSSPTLEVPGGATSYYVTIDKTSSGAANYSFTYHCESRSGEHTGTSLTTLQNQ